MKAILKFSLLLLCLNACQTGGLPPAHVPETPLLSVSEAEPLESPPFGSVGIRPGSKGDSLSAEPASIRPGTKGDRLVSTPAATPNSSLTGTLEFPLDLSPDWLPELTGTFSVAALSAPLAARLGSEDLPLELLSTEALPAQNLLRVSFRLPEIAIEAQELLEVSSPRSGLTLKTLVPPLRRGYAHHLSEPLKLSSTARVIWMQKRQSQKKIQAYSSADWLQIESDSEFQQIYQNLSHALKNKKNIGKKIEELAAISVPAPTSSESPKALQSPPAEIPAGSFSGGASPTPLPPEKSPEAPKKNTAPQGKKN